MSDKIEDILGELESKLGGVAIELPTGGEWYDPGVFRDGTRFDEIMINPFTMMESLNFQNPFKLMNGDAVYDMISHVCHGVINPREMASVDVDAIAVAARNASYGRDMELEVTCNNDEMVASDDEGALPAPKCREVTKVKVDLNSVQLQYTRLPEKSEWKVKFENGQTALLRPIRYSFVVDQIKLAADARRNSKSADSEDMMEQVMQITTSSTFDYRLESIDSVMTSDGRETKDRDLIRRWLAKIPSSWSQDIADLVDVLNKGVMTAGMSEFSCPACGHKQEISVTGDPVRFFTPASLKDKP